MKLNLRQNALHTLQHAVEHLYWSEEEEVEGRSFDEESHAVQWRNASGHQCFYVPELGFTRPPAAYNLKFALLHLIQGSELLLKSYLEQCDAAVLFVAPGSQRTISLRKALDLVLKRKPTLLTPSEVKLLLEAKGLRNVIEHYQFDLSESNLRTLCADFVALAALLAQQLHSMSLVEALSYDYLHDRPDRAADYLSTVLTQASTTGRFATRRAGELWAAGNSCHTPFLCLSCGARAVSSESRRCMGCGTEGDEDLAALIEDFCAILARPSK